MNRRIKEALKTSLAMVIVFGFALWMDWERPYWAGFAVAVISLSTVGLSINKGLKRLFGTLLAFVVSLTIIAFSIQDRWLFITLLSLWLALCSYKYSYTSSYFWFVAGFVTSIICFDAGTDPVNAFNTAILRVQETSLGILTYSLVNIFIWPNSTLNQLNSATATLIATQRKLYMSYLSSMMGQTNDNATLRLEEVQQRNKFNQTLIAAMTDTYEVGEIKGQWRQFQIESADLMLTIDRWYESLQEVSELNLNELLPHLEALNTEIDARFSNIEQMLADHPPQYQPQVIELTMNEKAIEQLPYFHKAALMVTHIQLQHIEQLSRDLFNTICSLKGFGVPVPEHTQKPTPWASFLPDVDCMIRAINVVANMWVAYIIWILIEVPGGTGFVGMIAPFALVLAASPQLKVITLLPPLLITVVFAGGLNMLLMPHITGFTQLGPMIFLSTFTLCYLFSEPRHAITRALSLVMLLSTIGVNNEQTYNFLSVANTFLNNGMMMLLLAIMASFPRSIKPEHAVMRLIHRFFHSSQYLINHIDDHLVHKKSVIHSWKKAFHNKEISTIPTKLLSWSPIIDGHSKTPSNHTQLLTLQLYILTFRIQTLMTAGTQLQDETLVKILLSDVHIWRDNIQELFQRLAHSPASLSAQKIHEQLQNHIDYLEDHIEQTMNQRVNDKNISNLDRENFYLLLGAYRGVSESVSQYAKVAEKINWAQWKENTFS